MVMNETLSHLYRALADTLNISETKTEEIINSYKAVGTYLGEMETELDINVFPQGSLALGTIIKPLPTDRNGDYDVDLVCSLENGGHLSARGIKQIVGKRLRESVRYDKMLDDEGKRCWTLNYSGFHMDILPCVPSYSSFPQNTNIRLSHKNDDNTYSNRVSNPKGYRNWFIEEMQSVFTEAKKYYATENRVDIEDVKLFQLRTPLQMAIQILKRHRDIMFEGKENKPISIIITTLAAKAYSGEIDLFESIANILNSMENYIETTEDGEVKICNPTNNAENFADKWQEEPDKRDAFYSWLTKAKEDIVEDPLNFIDGLDNLKKKMQLNFGVETVDKTFETYGTYILNERINGKLNVSDNGKLTTLQKQVVAPVPNHTFYGGVKK